MHNRQRAFIDDLDSLPYPAYHLLPIKHYRPSTGNYKRLPGMSIISSRGCPGRCTFCNTDACGKKVRFRSAENIIGEIELLQKKYGVREISFYDDTFTAFKANVLKFCRLIRDKKIDITFSCMSRVDMVDFETLKAMREAGCHQIGYGIESASPQIMAAIKKPITLERVKSAVDDTRRAKIDVRGMFMFGNPGETKETMEQTLRLAKELRCDIAVFNIATPYPGTEMFSWAKEKGYLMHEDWGRYDLSHCVMRLPTVAVEEIETFYRKAYRAFYMRLGYIVRRIFKMRTLDDWRVNISFFFTMLKQWRGR